MNITILGAGAWGTALAISLASRHQVVLWGRNADAMEQAKQQQENMLYLPGFALPKTLRLSADFDEAMRHVTSTNVHEQQSLLIIASPVAGLRQLLEQMQPYPISNIIWLCKGFEKDSHLLPHQIVQNIFGDEIPCGVLSGPSFAQEVARGLPCALTIASHSTSLRNAVVTALHGDNIRIYSTDDVVGVEVGGAVKNILAIATGIADGLELGLNARAALITRGLAEITRLGSVLGGKTETFMGLTGIGDLILTSTGNLSRNRTVGLALAQGKTLSSIVAELGHVAEGVPCAQVVRALASKLGVEMPITNAVAAVLFDGDTPQTMLTHLLSRNPKDETS